jgi:quinolinate synthase
MEATLEGARKMMKDNGYLRVPIPEDVDLVGEINRLRKEKNAVILAHYYQDKTIQDIADFIGDSLGLSQEAAKTKADIIVFAGVYFMAETAKILNPEKKVLLPDLNSGCSLADNCSVESLIEFRKKHPDHILVTYINCSAEVKSISDYVCTSANAEKVINSIPKDQAIIFAPDKNLGAYLVQKTGREMKLWDGSCIVHESFSLDKLLDLHLRYPDALIVAHPESEENVLRVANYIGSTSGMIEFVKKDNHQSFIVATEEGILHQMQKEVPHKKLIPAPVYENNSCACSQCASMRLNTLGKVYLCLKYETPEVFVAEDIRTKALVPITNMLNLSKV